MKPWDVLRKQTKPPMLPGKWETSTQCPMELSNINGEVVGLKLGYMKDAVSFRATTLREMGEWMLELADQLEGK